MNREFKFRAWHPSPKKMIDFTFSPNAFYIQENYKKPLAYTEHYHPELGKIKMIDPSSIPSMDDMVKLYLNFGLQENGGLNLLCIEMNDPALVIMQYLGEDCKDSEGIEICEGDIVELEGEKYEVLYSTIDAMFCLNGYYREIVEWRYTKIIGNIYQNPEELK